MKIMNKAMNENLDLTQILANVPIGTKLFTTEYGYVEFYKISTDDCFPIVVKSHSGAMCYTKDGYACTEEYRDKFAEQCLFPAHDQRDWSKFVVPTQNVKVTLHPFDKVLVRDDDKSLWSADFFSCYTKREVLDYICVGSAYNQIIPYNKDTAHLLGTNEKCPIDYDIEFSKEFKED